LLTFIPIYYISNKLFFGIFYKMPSTDSNCIAHYNLSFEIIQFFKYNIEIMSNRTTVIYGNCQVFSPDNKLMFRCLEKKARWYLDRNLAIILSNDPLSIQLTFQPKGNGEKSEYLKAERKNTCIVCGEEDLSKLTKHHLVPYEYRQYMPDENKNHSSAFVVPICISCHKIYETNFSSKLKEKLAIQYNTDSKKEKDDLSRIMSKLNCLIKHSNKIPSNIKLEIESHIRSYLDNNNLDYKLDINNIDNIKELVKILKSPYKDKEKSHGQLVIEKCNDLSIFEKEWVNNFVTNMNPKHMPEFIKDLRAYQ